MTWIASILTWLQRRIQWIVARVLAGGIGALTFVLRRGRHREWRRDQERRARGNGTSE